MNTRNNKSKQNLIIPIIISLISITTLLIYFRSQTQPVDIASKEMKRVTIYQGESVSQIASILKSQNVIKNTLIFKIYVRLKNYAPNLQAGDYILSPAQNLSEVVETIRNGKTEDVKITILEGLRREEIANYLQGILGGNIEQEFLQKSRDLEGKLFPDTYFIKKGATADSVIKIMTTNFEVKYKETISASKSNNLSKDQIITLASIVEREVRQDKDRSLVAGILLKRLKNDWPIEADAAVQYAIGFESKEKTWWKKTLTVEDLEIDSPYNTRKNPYLPPHPICNPGLASLKAAANPQDSPYWFYLSDNEGTIHYSKTLEEHMENSNKYLDK